jgi:putative nucleotidyltransferase with HDIG domain
VLELINSAYYSLPSKVNSLTRAIILLGINTVKNVVLSFSILDAFSKRDSFRVFTANEFWAHSLSTAVAAKLLAISAGVPPPELEEFFVAGLMHDIGKIPLNVLFPDAYRQAAQSALGSGQGMRSAEEALIGTDHCCVGRLIARQWQLSDRLTGAIADHHSGGAVSPGPPCLADAVALADLMAHDMGATTPGGLSLDEPSRGRLSARWPCTADALAGFTAAVAVEVEKAKVFLDIASRR